MCFLNILEGTLETEAANKSDEECKNDENDIPAREGKLFSVSKHRKIAEWSVSTFSKQPLPE